MVRGGSLASVVLAWSATSRPARAQRGGGASRLRGPRWERVLEALEASFEALPASLDGDPSRRLARGLWAPESSVLVYEDRAYVTDAFLARSDKCVKHLEFLASLCSAGARVGNVAYDFHSGSSGTAAGAGVGNDLPPLVIAKRRGHRQRGVLAPNPYFGNLRDWNATRAEIFARAAARPWAGRSPRAFWRGRIISHDASADLRDDVKCDYEYGNHARLAAAALSTTAPDAVDVRCTTSAPTDCAPRNATRWPCPLLPYDEAMAEAARDVAKISGDAAVDRADYSLWRYVLNLPGATTGSYSKNLNHLWALDAVVLLWRAAHVEWYYPARSPRPRPPVPLFFFSFLSFFLSF